MKKTLFTAAILPRGRRGPSPAGSTQGTRAAQSADTAPPPHKPPAACDNYPCPAEVIRDLNVSDGAKLLMGVIVGLSRREGFCWAGDRYLADQIGKKPRSIPRLLNELAGELTEAKKNLGIVGTVYITTSRRRRSREIRVAKRFLRRDPGVVSHTPAGPDDAATNAGLADGNFARARRGAACSPAAAPPRESRRIAAHTNENNKENQYEETPDSESLDSDSLDSDSLDSERLHSASHQSDTLASLTAQFGAQFYHPDVVQAAEALDDLPGLPRYANIYRLEAGCDQDTWAEAVERTIRHWRAGSVEAPTPRAYLEATVKDVIQMRRLAEERRQRQEDRDVRGVTPSPPEVDDAELDARMELDPFADDLPAADPPAADPPAADPPAADPPAADPPADAPPPVNPPQERPWLEAIERLGLVADEYEDKAQSLWKHAVVEHERRECWDYALADTTTKMAAGKIRNAWANFHGAVHKLMAQDRQLVKDRAAGLSPQEREAKQEAWENALAEEKRALNAPVNARGNSRTNGLSSVGAVADTILNNTTEHEPASQTLTGQESPVRPVPVGRAAMAAHLLTQVAGYDSGLIALGRAAAVQNAGVSKDRMDAPLESMRLTDLIALEKECQRIDTKMREAKARQPYADDPREGGNGIETDDEIEQDDVFDDALGGRARQTSTTL